MADVMTADHRTRSPRTAGAPAETSAAAPATAATAAAATPAAPGETIAISRSELDSALADFAALTAAVHGSFSASGATIVSVADGSIFRRIGLRAGDVITSVDGVRLRSLDDAANLYARASTAAAVTAQIVRGGKPVALRVVIQ
jgi:S1-C subfamily serine protease